MKKVSITLLAVFILGVLFVINSLTGNPVSKFLAETGAKKRVSKEFSQLDLRHERTFYNFKDARYYVVFQDENSIDTNFELVYDSFGRFRRDTYSSILFNTYSRFDKALVEYGKDFNQKIDGDYEVRFSIWKDEEFKKKVKLDEEVDLKNFPFRIEARVEAFRTKPSYEDAKGILKNLQLKMENEPVRPSFYSIILIPSEDRARDGEAQSWKNALSIYDISADLVREGTAKELEEFSIKQDKMGK